LPWCMLGIIGMLTLAALYWQFHLKRIEPAMLNEH